MKRLFATSSAALPREGATLPPYRTSLPINDTARLPSIKVGCDTRAMVRLTALTTLCAGSLIVTRQLEFPGADLWAPVAIVVTLAALAGFYKYVRPAPAFVRCLKSLAMLVAFSAAYATLMYALATVGRPLADPLLARMDAALGLSAETVVNWVNARPSVELAMRLVYFSLIPQTILAIVWLGLVRQSDALDKFLVRFMLAALITAMGFCLFPAIGTCASYDLPVLGHHQRFVEHMGALREGGRALVTWRDSEGLITFPSFHAAWAVLLTAAFWHQRGWRYPVAALNLAILASTVTSGMHYFIDVLAGLAIAALVIVAVPSSKTKSEPSMRKASKFGTDTRETQPAGNLA